MATTTDFRNGLVIRLDGDLYTMVYFQHVKPGKGGAFIRTKLKNVKTGRVIDRTFRSGEKVEDVRLERRHAQFLYIEGEQFVFMDTETFEQVFVNREAVGDAADFMVETMEVDLIMHEHETLDIELPIFVELTITETDPGVRGDTASGGSKPATLESGAVIQVPLFIEQGEKVKVDTRTGEYVERVKE